ncbi:MAG: hypothetical protein KC589_06080, partial [Nanoarchaeota archaeon]|nr:hypothetical protein [Nanoarchaeota archaeon]
MCKKNMLRIMIYFLALFFTLIFFVNSTYSININTCTNLTVAGGEYNLTSDIIDSSNSTCIIVKAQDVQLNCLGNTIDGDDSNSLIGISSWSDNFSLKNCRLNDWVNVGLLIFSVNENNITNITINNTNYAISLAILSHRNYFDRIFTTNIGSFSLYSDTSQNVSLTNSNFKTAGVELLGTSSANFYNVSISGADKALQIVLSKFTGTKLNFSNNNWGVKTTNGGFNPLNITNSEFKENKYQDLLGIDESFNNKCNYLHFSNITLSGSHAFGFYKNQNSLSINNQDFSRVILCNVSNSVFNNINVKGSTTLRNNGLQIINGNNINFTNINAKNLYEGLSIFYSENLLFDDLDIRNVSTNPYLDQCENVSFNGILASSNSSFGGTYYFYSKENNKYKLKNKSSFPNEYETKFISIGNYEEFGEIKKNLILKIEQKNKEFAGIEYLKLNFCGTEYFPKKAYFENTKRNILKDILGNDFNVAVANEENLIIEFGNISECLNKNEEDYSHKNQLIIEIKANEHKKPIPLYYPRDKIYYNYIKTNITIAPNIDGKINEVDNL